MSLRSVSLVCCGLFAISQIVTGCGSPSADDSSAVPGGASGDSESGGAASGGAANGGRPTGNGGALIRLGMAGSNDAGAGFGEECARSTTEAELVPANLLFVLDISGSMRCNPPDGDAALGARCARYPEQEDLTKPSKWDVTRQALRTAVSGLVGKPNVSLGLSLFPTGSECGVASEPSVPMLPLDDTQLDGFDAALDAAVPDGETPVAGATILSFAYLADALRAGKLSGNSFVVLLTDGAETCAPSALSQLVDTDVPNARLFDIRTFVIGAPGSESARALLSQLAWEGGTATADDCDHSGSSPDVGDCHFDMTSTTDFANALAEVLARISQSEEMSCVLDVPQNPDGGAVDLKRVNVTFTAEGETAAEHIAQDVSASCDAGANGWQYSADHRQILLCGDACSHVRAQTGALSIVLGCPTEVVK